MSVSKAYEKMFKDGSAFKPIRIVQPTPDNPEGSMGGDISSVNNIRENKPDGWEEFDSKMMDYIENKKSKKTNGKEKTEKIEKIEKLEKRINFLETIVEKIIKTQMEILKNG